MSVFLIQVGGLTWNNVEFPAKIIEASSRDKAVLEYCNQENAVSLFDGIDLDVAVLKPDVVLVSRNEQGVFVIESEDI